MIAQFSAHPSAEPSLEERLERAKNLVAEWNAKFFAPRGCRLDFTEPKGKAKHQGLGFQVGDYFLGVSTGKSSGGVGLKFGNVLLGVANPTGEKTDEKKK